MKIKQTEIKIANKNQTTNNKLNRRNVSRTEPIERYLISHSRGEKTIYPTSIKSKGTNFLANYEIQICIDKTKNFRRRTLHKAIKIYKNQGKGKGKPRKL